MSPEGLLSPGGAAVEHRDQPAGADGGPEEITYQKITPRADSYSVAYGFRNFNRDALSVHAELARRDVEAAMAEFGYSREEFSRLDAWYERVQEEAIAEAGKRFFSGKVSAPTREALGVKLAEARARNEAVRAGLDRKLEDLSREYRRRRVKIYSDAGFRMKGERLVEADVAALARRNARRMAPVSLAFADVARSREYGTEELVGAVTAMAQTALRYEIPATQADGKMLGGVLPPPKSFVLGRGDCDTKSALIGSILLNWPNVRLLGLEIPGHYLLAYHRAPGRGEAYIEHEGRPYVMIEAAGPGWIPPGKVGAATEAYLDSGRLFSIRVF